MSKKTILIPILLLIGLFTWNCEKDDICDESASTTPRLIMQFYNINDPTAEKQVNSLLVATNNGLDTLGIFDADSKIELPLKILADQTQYTFTLNSDDTTADNTDNITFNYTRDDVFVSRACGYKTVFLLDAASPFIQENGPDNQWMQDVTVEQPYIQNENEVHISVLF